MNSLRISVASLTAAINKAQLGEVVVVHKDRAQLQFAEIFSSVLTSALNFQQASTYSLRRSELDQTFPRTKLFSPPSPAGQDVYL